MGPWQALPVQMGGLESNDNDGHFIFPKALKLESRHHLQFNVMPRNL